MPVLDYDSKFWLRNGIKILFLFAFMSVSVAFRTFDFYPEARWNVSPAAPKLWIRFCSRPNVGNNDLPTGDPLKNQTLTFTNLVQSVLDDYNTISTSYLRLYDSATDATFATSSTNDHVIEICFNDAGSGLGGDSGVTHMFRASTLTRCTIDITNHSLESPKAFVHILAHEIGHCLGLDHPQDTKYAIMSYFSNVTRLAIDDKAGITFLYPADPSYAVETPTFGLSCAPKQ